METLDTVGTPCNTRNMTTTQAIAKAFPTASTHTQPDGRQNWTVKEGSKAVDFTTLTDGTLRVSMWIDYGVEGRSWCDGATYKTAAGAVRRARGFLA